MEQRRLRLGDVLDDYCPRERRVSNHVIVAIVDDRIIKTRCTTCDTEHPYKHGRQPARRRKKDEPSALFKEVLDGLTEGGPIAGPQAPLEPDVSGAPDERPAAPPAGDPEPAEAPPPVARPSPPRRLPEAPAVAAETRDRAPESEADDPDQPSAPSGEDGPHHRVTLIRATLPRPEGQPVPRQPPEFTMHHVRDGKGARRKTRGGRGWSGGPMSSGTNTYGAPRARGGPGGRPGREPSRPRGRRRSR